MPKRRHEGQRALGHAIRSLRRRFGLTQAELGRRSDIHATWINRIEAGNIDPTYANVARIAHGLGVSLAQLAEEEARIEGALARSPRIEGAAVDLRIHFGRNVRRLRQSAGLSRRGLAERRALPEDTIWKIERGTSIPRLDTVMKLIASLDTTPDELLEPLPSWLPGECGTGRFTLSDASEAA